MNNMTWHCELILQNEKECAGVVDCLVHHVMNKIYHDYAGRAYSDQRKARIYVLSEFLKGYIEELTDVDNDYSPMTKELICGALQEIDFRSIAEDLIGDYTPKSPAEIAESEEYFVVMGFGNYDVSED